MRAPPETGRRTVRRAVFRLAALVTLFVGFAALSVAWLLVAVGMGRRGPL